MRKARLVLSIALATALLGGSGTVLAADATTAQTSQKPNAPRVVPPPPPQELTKGKEIKPGVTIVHRNWAEFKEYSIGGRVYAVEVTPRWGPPYWLYDSDGNGTLEMRGDVLHQYPQTVQWKILTW